MKKKPVYFTIEDEYGNIIKQIPWTEADDDWIRAARLNKKAREGDKEAAKKIKKIQNTQMVEYVEEDDEDYESKPKKK